MVLTYTGTDPTEITFKMDYRKKKKERATKNTQFTTWSESGFKKINLQVKVPKLVGLLLYIINIAIPTQTFPHQNMTNQLQKNFWDMKGKTSKNFMVKYLLPPDLYVSPRY